MAKTVKEEFTPGPIIEGPPPAMKVTSAFYCALHLKADVEVPAVTMYLGHTLCADCVKSML